MQSAERFYNSLIEAHMKAEDTNIEATALIRARDSEIVEACRAAIAKGWDFSEPTLAYAKVQAILDSVYMSLA